MGREMPFQEVTNYLEKNENVPLSELVMMQSVFTKLFFAKHVQRNQQLQ